MQYLSHTLLPHIRRAGLLSVLSLGSFVALAAPQSGVRSQVAEPAEPELRSPARLLASAASASSVMMFLV